MRLQTPYFAFALLFGLPVAAQSGAAIFHHFHRYPTGQYTTQHQGSISGLPPSAPITQVACTSPASPAQAIAASNLRNSVAATQNCTMRVLRDEEKLAEYEQTCKRGPAVQVTHGTMTVVDDRTLRVDTISKLGPRETSSHSVAHYDGPCTAAQLAEVSYAAMSKPNPEECAEFAASKKEMAGSLKSCESLPAEQRTTCMSSLQSASTTINQMTALCAK